MPHRELDSEEVLEVLRRELVARVAFRDGDDIYLIPLGYVLVDGALYGVSERGRKTELAAADPRVAFQVDSSSTTGVFQWRSVTGAGRFEIVTGEPEAQRALAALRPVIAQAPGWWQGEQAPRIAAGELTVWRIVPVELIGRYYGPLTGAS